MLSRRSLFRMLGIATAALSFSEANAKMTARGASLAAQAVPALDALSDGQVAFSGRTDLPLEEANFLRAHFNVLEDVEQSYRHARRLEPEIDCLRSVSNQYKRRMQLQRDYDRVLRNALMRDWFYR